MKILKWIPNILSILRILLLYPIINMLNQPGIWRIYSFILFVIVVISDWLDGFLARRYQMNSKIGAFLDPLADKLVIIGLFISFVYVDPIVFPYWLIWLITVREFTLTVIRVGMYEKNEVKTLMVGKIKTVTQFATIFIIYGLFLIKDFITLNFLNFRLFLEQNIGNSMPVWVHLFGKAGSIFILNLPTISLSVTTFFSLFSGVIYIYKNKIFFNNHF